MKLLVVGLALLVGGAWAQHSFINRDTDLLALPSDQLIHSDVESIVPPPQRSPENLNVYYASQDQLPFGARLPGYEKIDYAYGYQIHANQGPKTIETLPTTTVRTTTTTEDNVLGSFHTLFFPDSIKQHFTPPDKDYLPPSPQSQSPKADQAPGESLLEVGDAYLLPALDFKTEAASPPAPSDQYLPPEPETKSEAPPPPPSNDYLPPDIETKSEATPTLPPPPSDEYLPPNNVTRTDPPPFLSEYLPPPPDPPAPSDRGSLHPIPPTLPKPAAGAAWKIEQESPVEGDQPTLQPLGIQTTYSEAPIEFVGQYPASPPLGIVGVPKDRVTAVAKETVKPPLGVVAAAEDPPLHFKAEAPAQLPVGAIGELQDELIIADSEKTAQPPLGVVGDLGTNKYFQSETSKLAPYAVVSEIQPETIKFQSEVVRHPPFALVSEPQINSIRAYAEQPNLSPYAVVGETVDNAIKAEAHSRPVVVGAIAKDNPACQQNDNCADDQICMDGLCVNACVIATRLCIGHASCVARRHIPGCVCPDMFTAVTRRRSGQDQYDCMPMMMMAAGTSRGVQITAGRASNTGFVVAPIADHRRTDSRIRYPPLAILSKVLLLRPPPGTPSA